MKKRLIAPLAVVTLVLAGCTKAASPSDSVSQPEDQLDQSVDSDPTAENMAKQCASGTPVTGRPVRIVTSIAPVTSLVGQLVAGTDVIVDGIVPEGENSHTYEPTPADLEKISRADVIISVGLSMENGFLAAVQSGAREDALSCELGTAALQKSDYVYDATFKEDFGTPNPHVWLNPQMTLRFLTFARDAVVSRASAAMLEVEQNYVELSKQVISLDTAMSAAAATVPVRNKLLYTYHDSLAYFALHFKFEIGMVLQPPTFGDPEAIEIADAIATIKSEKAPVFFGQTEFPGVFYDEIAKGAGVGVEMIADETLPGRAGSAGHSFGGLMKDTFVTVVRALGGDVTALESVNVDSGLKDKANYAD